MKRSNDEELLKKIETGGIAKEGRRNNASDQTTIQSMHDQAVGLGAACAGCQSDDDEAVLDGMVERLMPRLVDALMPEILRAFENLGKATVSGLTKTTDGLTRIGDQVVRVAKAVTAQERRLVNLEKSPAQPLPIVKCVDPRDQIAGFGQRSTGTADDLERLQAETTDPVVRAAIGAEIAKRMIRSQQNQR